LLKAWRRGDSAALDRLTPLVYEQLHRMARGYMRNERPGHTLQATALVNEAFLRLVDAQDLDWTDRAHFFAVCARVMRRILVDAARSRAARAGNGMPCQSRTGPFQLDVTSARPSGLKATLPTVPLATKPPPSCWWVRTSQSLTVPSVPELCVTYLPCAGGVLALAAPTGVSVHLASPGLDPVCARG